MSNSLFTPPTRTRQNSFSGLHSLIGLPTVPYFPGRPVSRPHCPATRPRPSRDAKCPVFRPWTNCIEMVQQTYAWSYVLASKLKLGQLILRKIIKIVATRCHFKVKMHQIRFRLGLLQRSSRLIAGFKVREREGQGRASRIISLVCWQPYSPMFTPPTRQFSLVSTKFRSLLSRPRRGCEQATKRQVKCRCSTRSTT